MLNPKKLIQSILAHLPQRTYATYRVRYVLWRIMNWRGGYGEFYSRVIDDKLSQGGLHRTLGTHTWDIADGPAWASMEFEKRGMEILPDLAAFGLTSDSVCVDYGCGSLRIGQHLIRNLGPGCYWGLDVTDTFFQPASAALPADLIATKKPNLHVISDDVLGRLERKPPDFVFSYAVLKHVPPKELDAFFDRFMRLIGPRTIALVYFADAPTERIAPMSWFHPAEQLIGIVLQRLGDAAVGVTRVGLNADFRRRHPRSVLWIAGSEVYRALPSRIFLPEEAGEDSGAAKAMSA